MKLEINDCYDLDEVVKSLNHYWLIKDRAFDHVVGVRVGTNGLIYIEYFCDIETHWASRKYRTFAYTPQDLWILYKNNVLLRDLDIDHKTEIKLTIK